MVREKFSGPGDNAEGSVMIARSTGLADTAAAQGRRPAEARLTANELSDEAIQKWILKLREVSGYGQAHNGTITFLEGALQNKLGSRFRNTRNVKSDRSFASDLTRLLRFQEFTPDALLKDPRVDRKFVEAYEHFLHRIAGFQSVYAAFDETSAAGEWQLDDDGRAFFAQIYTNLENSITIRIGKQRFWKAVGDEHAAENWTRQLLKHEVPRDMSVAGCIIISNAYELELLMKRTHDPETLDILRESHAVVKRLARDVQREMDKFAELGHQLDLFAEVPPGDHGTALAIWRELLT